MAGALLRRGLKRTPISFQQKESSSKFTGGFFEQKFEHVSWFAQLQQRANK
jgi:hypothetical protein